ncbi:ribonuclease J [Bacillus sp. Marseille-P3661]|uniref:ribonuclease J n=1 Tax=Bacillus sp. Marseille-P3661 TaxID=1936234 RepID=UPI000C84DC05|nr:ribonuclease J [Bacillus sp. Marseille-P3661]
MLKKETNPVKIFALGGLGEIGKNMYVIEVGPEIYVIDAGLKFPEDEMLGIDFVIPDISYLVENRHRIVGIFLTHGHEDHIGSLSYVLQKLRNISIYGTKLTLGLVSDRFNDAGVSSENLCEIDSESTLEYEYATVSFFRTTHSIPDSVGICIHTEQGVVVHTGDFKMDPTPVDGIKPDYYKMSAIGQEGVLCLLSDSTNAEVPGITDSESAVGNEICDSFSTANGRIIIATFATNVHRVQQIIDAAVLTNRKVAILGSSMLKVFNIAMELGYLHVPENVLISISEIEKWQDQQIAVLTSGAHGEPIAALSKLVQKSNKPISIKNGDTVMIAASPIPGNEKIVSKTIDALFRAGAKVIYNQKKIHVSGHGSQEELKMMITILNPQYLMPIHGEYKMQKAHAKIAETTGMDPDQIFLMENGDVLEFKNNQGRLAGKIPAGNVLIDGLGIGDIGNIVLRDRRLLSQDGILIVVVTLSKEKNLIVSGPEILSRGFVYVRESEELFQQSTEMVQQIILKNMKDQVIDWSTLKTGIRESLSHFLFEKTKRRPMILPIIMEI